LLAHYAAGCKSQGNSTVTTKYTDVQADQALSKQALHDLGMAYARAVDRADASLMASVFHDDATVVTGVFSGNAAEYAVKIAAFWKQ
jgi:hypothetical protein